MIQVDADILLIDEVLAVGDAAFQQKCFDVFHRMRDEGKTILFVTHDMGAVERFCDRAMLLERGRDASYRRARRRRRAATSSSTSAATARRAPTRRRGAERVGDGDGGDRRARGSRTRAASARRLPQGAACTVARARALPRARSAEPGFGVCSRTTGTIRCSRRPTTDGDAPAGLRGRATRRVVHASTFENVLRARPLSTSTPWLVARAAAAPTRSTAGRASASAVVDRRAHRSGGLVDLPRTTRIDARRAGAGDDAPSPSRRPAELARPVGARRRPAALRLPDVDARRHRLQAALLRLGARLPVAADAAAAAVRRPLPRVHGVRAGSAATSRTTPSSCSPTSCCSRSSPEATGRRSASVVDRENARAQDPLPAHGDPAVGRPHGAASTSALNLSRCSSSCSPPASSRAGRWLQLAAAARALLAVLAAGARDAALGALRALPRRRADLGGRARSCSSTPRRCSTRSRRSACPTASSNADHVQPARGASSSSSATR